MRRKSNRTLSASKSPHGQLQRIGLDLGPTSPLDRGIQSPSYEVSLGDGARLIKSFSLGRLIV